MPLLEPGRLEALWFQVSGTICNIQCAHCFISCGPTNRTFGFLSLDDIARALEQSVPLGVREFYFTGGEPFLHPAIVEILSLSLDYGPTTVLTNGLLLKGRQLARLAEKAAAVPHSLEFRVSIDGADAETHDALRGSGSFEQALGGVELLLAHGFLPIVTAVQSWDSGVAPEIFERFVAMLRARGYRAPRVKLMPALRIGAEAERSGGYRSSDVLTRSMMAEYDLDLLICAHARIVTDRGVWVCPILLDRSDGRLADQLTEAARVPYPLRHPPCTTCWQFGAICSNAGGSGLERAMAP